MAQALGRGLASLIPNKKQEPSGPVSTPQESLHNQPPSSATPDQSSDDKDVQVAPIHDVYPNPRQPRKRFDDVVLKELAGSIKEHGVLQPILVQKTSDGEYQIIAGERRLQAAKLAGLTEVPIIVKKVSEQQNLEIALVENIQRHDLNPVEEAKAFTALKDDFNMTYDDIAQKVGKDRTSVINTMRLMDLPEEVKRGLTDEKITEGHARAILTEKNIERQIAIYQEILAKKLTVRQVEALARGKKKTVPRTQTGVPPAVASRIDEIEKLFGTKIDLTKRGTSGKLAIQFFSEEELERILDTLETQEDSE